MTSFGVQSQHIACLGLPQAFWALSYAASVLPLVWIWAAALLMQEDA